MTRVMVYDGDNVAERLDETGTPVVRFSHGPGIDEPLAINRGGARGFYEADGLGSITSLTNAQGQIVNTYQTSVFGVETSVTEGINNPYQFTGREYDRDTGLYYYRARYYDPQIGRFISEDPLGFMGGPDFYPYAGNNPVTFLDPYGLLVRAVYDRASGQLSVTDLDTGESVTIQAESGGKPFGEPIPIGNYEILEQQRKPTEFRLDKQDSNPYDDVDQATGRSHLRLHRPGLTTGCIAAKKLDEWNKLYRLIRKTKTDVVPDNFKPWWKIWSTEQGYARHYGALTVQ